MEGYARLEELDMATLSIHGDHGLEHTPDVAPPLHLTTTFFTGNSDGLVYSRAHTMTRTRLEKVLGELDGGHAVTYPTGMSTVTALLFLLKPQVVYIAEGGYFGVHDALQHWKQLIEAYAGEGAFKVVDLNGGQLEALAAKEKEESGGKEQRVLIWLETPKNPTCTLQDVPYYSKLAKAIGAKVAVDSTFATPILQKPLSQGADYTVHSCSKFLSGHSDLTAGAIITKTEEEAKVLRQERNYRGNALGNMETWLLLRSLRSLSVRVVQQSQSAAELAKWLDSKVGEEGSHVKKVWHPTLKSNGDNYELCQRLMNGKGPGILSVELDTVENTFKFQKSLKLFTDATSLGGYESLIDYRYRWDKTCSPTLLRVSIGLEATQDLINDMDAALKSL